MSIKQTYDVIVIGGGASGMMAAGRAGERKLSVLLMEKNKELGKKLSITGGGRCNIFNAEEDVHALLSHYSDAEKFLYSPFSQFGVQDTWTFFEERGVPLMVEGRKKAFPQSENAEDVTRLMKKYLTHNHVQIKTGLRVEGFKTKDGNIVGVKTPDGVYTAKKYILATGGLSHQETGSTGEGFHWLKKLGHTIHKPNPHLVPLSVEDEWVRNLKGTSLSFMKITFGANLSKVDGRFSRVGSLLFTHFGISGPLVINSASLVKKLLAHGPVLATIDLYPDTEIGTLRKRVLAAFDKNKNKTLKNVVKEFVPHGFDQAFLFHLSSELLEERVHSITKEERYDIADRLKALPFTIDGTMGMSRAIVSDGGIDLTEVDTKTMRSKLHKNLYLTGDILNINRPSGGYSLQLCWTTGYVAGSHA